MLLHIEIQGDTSKKMEFAERMYEYFSRIMQRYRKRVSALAIFTGKNGGNMPGRFSYEYRGTRFIYEYPTFSIADFPDQDLAKSNNPFAHVLVAAKMSLLESSLSDERWINKTIY